jgi:hypothetical protein
MTSVTTRSPISYISDLLGTTNAQSRRSESIAAAITKAINYSKKNSSEAESTTAAKLNLSTSVLTLLQSGSQKNSGVDLSSQILSTSDGASAESSLLAASLAKKILGSASNGSAQKKASNAAQVDQLQSVIAAYQKSFNPDKPAAAPTPRTITSA